MKVSMEMPWLRLVCVVVCRRVCSPGVCHASEQMCERHVAGDYGDVQALQVGFQGLEWRVSLPALTWRQVASQGTCQDLGVTRRFRVQTVPQEGV